MVSIGEATFIETQIAAIGQPEMRERLLRFAGQNVPCFIGCFTALMDSKNFDSPPEKILGIEDVLVRLREVRDEVMKKTGNNIRYLSVLVFAIHQAENDRRSETDQFVDEKTRDLLKRKAFSAVNVLRILMNDAETVSRALHCISKTIHNPNQNETSLYGFASRWFIDCETSYRSCWIFLKTMEKLGRKPSDAMGFFRYLASFDLRTITKSLSRVYEAENSTEYLRETITDILGQLSKDRRYANAILRELQGRTNQRLFNEVLNLSGTTYLHTTSRGNKAPQTGDYGSEKRFDDTRDRDKVWMRGMPPAARIQRYGRLKSK